MPTLRRSNFGFTLIELLVSISIIALLTTVGIAVFSNVTSKVRDTERKNDLQQIQAALELYYETKSKYPEGAGINESNQQLCINVDDELVEYLKSAPSDPSDKSMKYCYQATTDGKKYALFAKLENCDEANVNQNKCNQQNDALTYKITSDETFIVQAPIIPTPSPIASIAPDSVPESSFERTDLNVVAATLPPTCNGMNVRSRYYSYIYPGSEIKIRPYVTDWSKTSKVMVYLYQDPVYSRTHHPYEDAKWTYVGEVTNSNAELEGQGGYFYEGKYVLRMDVYDLSGKKVAGLGTDLEGKCLQDFIAQEHPDSRCEDDIPVYPNELKAYVLGKDVFLKWKAYNHQGHSGDTFYAYRSDQAGFTVDPSKRVISTLTPGSGSVFNSEYHRGGSYFYKVGVFNEAGEVVSTDQAAAHVPRDSRSCSGTIFGPPGAYNAFRLSSDTLKWTYMSVFTTLSGWYLNGNDGSKFAIDYNQIALQWRCPFWWETCATWTVPYIINGNYSVQAYDYCGRLGGVSNEVSFTSSGGLPVGVVPPDGAPSNITAEIPSHAATETVSWRDNSTNEKGFHVYRDTTPLDLTRSTQTNNSNSYLRQALFENVPSGRHYFAVKADNQCGSGWSNYIEVNIP